MSLITPGELFNAAEREMRAALGLSDEVSPADWIRLTAATALRLRFDQLESAVRTGTEFDPDDLRRTGEALAAMFAPTAEPEIDLTRFTDDQLTILERARAIVDTGQDPGYEGGIAEVQNRYDAEVESHRKTIGVLQGERRQREELTTLAAERWQELETLRTKLAESATLVEAQSKLIQSLEERVNLYRRLMPETAAVAGGGS
jgi:hypothetical protein